MRRSKDASPNLELMQAPPWRADAVQLLFSTYWDDYCEPEANHPEAMASRDALEARRAFEWERVVGRLGACGAWDILFPSEERSDADQVAEIADRFLGSGLLEGDVKLDSRRVQRVARRIREQVDRLLDEG